MLTDRKFTPLETTLLRNLISMQGLVAALCSKMPKAKRKQYKRVENAFFVTSAEVSRIAEDNGVIPFVPTQAAMDAGMHYLKNSPIAGKIFGETKVSKQDQEINELLRELLGDEIFDKA